MKRKQIQLLTIIIIVLGVVNGVSSILGNIAASTIPASWKPYLPWSWTLFLIFTLIGIALIVWERSLESSIGTQPLLQEKRHRSLLLVSVKKTWIHDFLDRSLHHVIKLDIGIEFKPDAVTDSWSLIVRRPDYVNTPLPFETKIVDIFDNVSSEMLILGEPGSGKTTILLELARDLISRAEQDDTLPIPVVFNLISWSEKRLPLDTWLIKELIKHYKVNKMVALEWINSDSILPLLDGLDEVLEKYRSECVDAINNFRRKHMVGIVVCSRQADYEHLTTQLHLHSAIVLQPLTSSQINAYLASMGNQTLSIQELIKNDIALSELATSPLMLNVIILAYQGRAFNHVPALSVEERRFHLFSTYVDQMFMRRGIQSHYTPQQTKHWLAFLARGLSQSNQAQLLLEQLQPDWLPKRTLTKQYHGIVTTVTIALFGGIGWIFSIVAGYRVESIQFGLALGTLVGIVFWLFIGREKNIVMVEQLSWSWINAIIGFWWLFGRAFLSGVVVTWFLVQIGQWISGMVGGWLIEMAMIIASIQGLNIMAALLIGINFGATGSRIERRVTPNHGFWLSIQNAGRMGFLVSIAVAIGTTLAEQWYVQLVANLAQERVQWQYAWWFGWDRFFNVGLALGPLRGLAWGLFAGLMAALFRGGYAVIQHSTLRFILWRNNLLPWNLVKFLKYADERVFMRRIEGSYVFIHRILLEYFTRLDH